MSKRLRCDDDYTFTPDLYSLLDTTGSLGLPEGDTAWMFETHPDTDPTQMQFSDSETAWVFETEADPTQKTFSDFGSSEMDLQPLPLSESHIHTNSNTSADLLASHDLSAGYQTSNASSSSVPSSRSASASSSMFLWSSASSSSCSSSSPSSRFPVAVEALPHTGQVNLCRSLCRAETCLAAALRALTTLHVAHSACLSAHQEVPVQQARKMETVLSTNKDVVASMAPILACSCSGKSLVQLLLLSVCGNLIAWNSAMISADLEPGQVDPFSHAGSGSLSAGPGQPVPRARVLPQPITIGQHQISGKLGRALHAQVMAGELRILEGLVDALSRRLCEASRSDGGAGASSASPAAHSRNFSGRGATTSRDATPSPSQQSKPLSHVVHRHIISSLRTRLENTRARIFSGLG